MAITIKLPMLKGEASMAFPFLTLKSLLDEEDRLKGELRRVRQRIRKARAAERAKNKPVKPAPKSSIKDKLKGRKLSYTVARERGLI